MPSPEELDRPETSQPAAPEKSSEKENPLSQSTADAHAGAPSPAYPAETEEPLSRPTIYLLFASVFIISACGIIYELLVGSISSYFVGNSVEQYSLTIGFFLFAMGLGSWLSRAFVHRLLRVFITLEIWLGLVGGLTVPLLYLAYTNTEHYQYCMLFLALLLGTFIGLEIPILLRLLRTRGSLRTVLSDVLSMDYLGALVAAILFPFVLFPLLGSMHTSLVTGGINVGVGAAVLLAVSRRLSERERTSLTVQIGLIGLTLFLFYQNSVPLVQKWEAAIYSGQIVHNEESKYQKIVVTRWKDEVRLFLNEHLQFSSADEYRYHEALVHPAMSLAPSRERVLIIGGGDGLAAREVLKFLDVKHVDLVDLDPAMTRLGRRNLFLTDLNDNSLSRQQVTVTNEDAFTWLQRSHEPYSVIIIDLPDPREEALAKLYSVESYRLCRHHLARGGILVTQATSPYYSRQAFWCIGASLELAGFRVRPYHAYVPSFGEWGFHLASRTALNTEHVAFTAPARFINEYVFQDMLFFDADMARVPVEANTLDMPQLARYYRNDYDRW